MKVKMTGNLRENHPIYEKMKENNGLGIPVFELEDGTLTFDMTEVLGK